MLYLIDSANKKHIEEALSLGVYGITANTTMYRKENTNVTAFIQEYSTHTVSFLSAEVIGTYDEMLIQAHQHLQVDKGIIIKINFSIDGLKLVNTLHAQGYKTALTLVFTVSQAMAAINVLADYIFFFIGRNEEYGQDALSSIASIQQIIDKKQYTTKLVCASIKNMFQLEKLAQLSIDYAALPYDLFLKSLHHPLSEQGAQVFIDDFHHIS